MVKIEDFHIKFNEQWAVYKPGQTVTGTVFLRFPERMFCDSVQAQCFGSARIFWVEQQVKPPHGLRSQALSAEKVYFDMKQLIWKDSSVPEGKIRESPSIDKLVEQSRGLKLKEVAAMASKDRPFLDGGLHQANLMEGETIKHSRKEYFTIIKPFDLNVVPRARQPVTEHKERHLQTIGGVCCTGGEGQVSVMGTMQKLGHVPGEQLRASAEIDNQSGATIVKMKARLVQHVVCYSDIPECKIHESAHQVAAIVKELKVRPGESWLWDGNPGMFVPAIAPTFREQQLLEVSYSLVIDVYASKEVPCLAVALPVLIGTVPINNNSLTVLTNGAPSINDSGEKAALSHRNVRPPSTSNGQGSDTPPPLYNDTMGISDAGPPPAYEQSILGRTETQGNLATDYLPRYAVYQFPAAEEPLVSA